MPMGGGSKGLKRRDKRSLQHIKGGGGVILPLEDQLLKPGVLQRVEKNSSILSTFNVCAGRGLIKSGDIFSHRIINAKYFSGSIQPGATTKNRFSGKRDGKNAPQLWSGGVTGRHEIPHPPSPVHLLSLQKNRLFK